MIVIQTAEAIVVVVVAACDAQIAALVITVALDAPEFRREVQHPSALNLLDFPFLGAAFASSKCSGRRRRGRENPIFPW